MEELDAAVMQHCVPPSGAAAVACSVDFGGIVCPLVRSTPDDQEEYIIVYDVAVWWVEPGCCLACGACAGGWRGRHGSIAAGHGSDHGPVCNPEPEHASPGRRIGSDHGR